LFSKMLKNESSKSLHWKHSKLVLQNQQHHCCMKNTQDDAYVKHVLCITFALRQNLTQASPNKFLNMECLWKEKTENNLEMKL
jgi:hypothetical protein